MKFNRDQNTPEFSLDAQVVVLYDGLHNGKTGRFVGLRADPNWADIKEQDGVIRSHPVLWLRDPAEIAASPEGIQGVGNDFVLSGKG